MKKIEKAAPIRISNCKFVGVEFDKKILETVKIMAYALEANAQGLVELAKVLQGKNVNIEALMKIVTNKEETK